MRVDTAASRHKKQKICAPAGGPQPTRQGISRLLPHLKTNLAIELCRTNSQEVFGSLREQFAMFRACAQRSQLLCDQAQSGRAEKWYIVTPTYNEPLNPGLFPARFRCNCNETYRPNRLYEWVSVLVSETGHFIYRGLCRDLRGDFNHARRMVSSSGFTSAMKVLSY